MPIGKKVSKACSVEYMLRKEDEEGPDGIIISFRMAAVNKL